MSIHLVPTHPSPNIFQLTFSILKTVCWFLQYTILILHKIFTVVSQWQCTSYPPFCIYDGIYVPRSLYTHLEYHDTAHNILLIQMCDELTDSDNCLCFLISSPLDISNIILILLLVLVDLRVHMYSVQSAMNLQILSRAWSACLRSLKGLLLDLHLICAEYLVNSLHIIVPAALPVSVVLVSRNFLVTLLLCFLRNVMTSDASSSLLVHGGSRMGSFLILYSLGRFCTLALDQYH